MIIKYLFIFCILVACNYKTDRNTEFVVSCAYSGVASVEVRIDDEEDVPYVYMEDPSAPEITFVRAPCPSKEVLYVRCSDLGMKRQFTKYFLYDKHDLCINSLMHL